MTNDNNNTWEQPFTVGDKTEPVQSFEAFQIWLGMGSKRSLKAVAERVEKSHDTIKKYSCTWKWSERLQDKLTYENQQIHGKQLEAMLYSLDVDNKRDMLIQQALGNIAVLIWNQSTKTNLGDSALIPKKYERKLSNPNLEYMERLLKMYCKLEKVHEEHQRKYVSLNKECLQYSTFDKQEDYVRMLKNAQNSQMDILEDSIGDSAKLMKDKDINMGGLSIMKARFFSPLDPYTTEHSNTEVAGEDKQQLEE